MKRNNRNMKQRKLMGKKTSNSAPFCALWSLNHWHVTQRSDGMNDSLNKMMGKALQLVNGSAYQMLSLEPTTQRGRCSVHQFSDRNFAFESWMILQLLLIVIHFKITGMVNGVTEYSSPMCWHSTALMSRRFNTSSSRGAVLHILCTGTVVTVTHATHRKNNQYLVQLLRYMKLHRLKVQWVSK